jgi:integrase
MASIKKNELKGGGVSYRIQAKFKDPATGEFKAKVLTWTPPEELGEYQIQKELRRIATEFEQKLQKQASGIEAYGGEIKLRDYAEQWLNRIKRDHSLVYWTRATKTVAEICEVFGHLPLNQISPVMIQKWIDKLCDHKCVREWATLKGGHDFTMQIHARGITVKAFEEKHGITKGTMHMAATQNTISVDKAKLIAKAFGKPVDELFELHRTERPFAKASIVERKKVLGTILATAKRQRLVEHNFASTEYIIPIKGTKTEVRILNDKEAKILANALTTEPNMRWKTSLMIVLFMGIRRGELAGLEWKDIDFEKRTMKISRACYEVEGYGIITKEPKTESGKRLLSIPDKLLEQLLAYKDWWHTRRGYFAELWGDCDRLFLTDEGKQIQPNLFRIWLQKILVKNGLPVVTLHALRHTNITLQLISGIDIKTVSARAGHSKASTTSDFYSHYVRNSDIHASEIINKLFD